MNTQHCCAIKKPSDDQPTRPASRWRRGGETVGWILPSATLILLPKCPMCVAAYVALFSGVGLSLASAATLRTAVVILCVATLLCLISKRVGRMVPGAKKR